MGDEVALLSADKYKGFLQGASISLDVCKQSCPKYPQSQKFFANFISRKKENINLGVATQAQITQNKKFAFAYKHESFLQIGTMLLDGDGQAFPKIASFPCLYNILKKKLEMKLIFCMQINIKISHKLISTL